jgi:hypothetical protein
MLELRIAALDDGAVAVVIVLAGSSGEVGSGGRSNVLDGGLMAQPGIAQAGEQAPVTPTGRRQPPDGPRRGAPRSRRRSLAARQLGEVEVRVVWG